MSYLSIFCQLSSFSIYVRVKIRGMEKMGHCTMYNIRSDAIRWQIPDFLSDGNSNVCIFPAFTCQNSHLKSLTLKMWINVTEYIRNVLIPCQISTYIKVIRMHFRQLSQFSRYLHFKIRFLENVCQGHDDNIRSGAIRWQIPDFISDGNSIVCYFSYHL